MCTLVLVTGCFLWMAPSGAFSCRNSAARGATGSVGRRLAPSRPRVAEPRFPKPQCYKLAFNELEWPAWVTGHLRLQRARPLTKSAREAGQPRKRDKCIFCQLSFRNVCSIFVFDFWESVWTSKGPKIPVIPQVLHPKQGGYCELITFQSKNNTILMFRIVQLQK